MTVPLIASSRLSRRVPAAEPSGATVVVVVVADQGAGAAADE